MSACNHVSVPCACGRMGPPKICMRPWWNCSTFVLLCLVDPCELVVKMRVCGEDRHCSESGFVGYLWGICIGIFLDWFSNRKHHSNGGTDSSTQRDQLQWLTLESRLWAENTIYVELGQTSSKGLMILQNRLHTYIVRGFIHVPDDANQAIRATEKIVAQVRATPAKPIFQTLL